jgi:Ca2+/H+ antiporter, TMEM165/GDT1 family
MDWHHVWPVVVAAFLASLVEFVEALTVVLAIGTVRGWRGALTGTGIALATLCLIVLVLGPALTQIPLAYVQLVVGALLLLFGMRWLRKAILRAAGVIALHDEAATFAKESENLRGLAIAGPGWDKIAVTAAFKITMLEGLEVIFIIIAVGAGPGLLLPACTGALAALVLVIALGLALHKPIATLPENALKFAVGVLLSAFGTFWVGEGVGADWPGEDWSILGLTFCFLIAALAAVWLCRQQAPHSTAQDAS